MKPFVVSFIGWSGSGKTTLLVQLVAGLKRLGLKVGVIKHSSHAHPRHKPGSDTELLERAGAEGVALATPQGIELVRAGPAEELVPRLIAESFSNVDLVLVEGWKDGPYPKVELVRAERGPRIGAGRDDVIAVVSDDEPAPACSRVFRTTEVSGLAVFLVGLARADESPT